jgi:hypothetical protein
MGFNSVFKGLRGKYVFSEFQKGAQGYNITGVVGRCQGKTA